MTLYYYGLLTVFGIVVCMIIIDPNVGTYIDLQIRNLFVQIKRLWYLATLYPTIKYNNWQLMRQLKKIRKDYNLPDE